MQKFFVKKTERPNFSTNILEDLKKLREAQEKNKPQPLEVTKVSLTQTLNASNENKPLAGVHSIVSKQQTVNSSIDLKLKSSIQADKHKEEPVQQERESDLAA